MSAKKTYFNWSTGKDSALALYHLQQDKNYQIDALVTSINMHYDRVSMHGLRRELMLQQVKEIGIPASCIELPQFPSNEDYENIMRTKVSQLKNAGFEYAAFGDIFLEDLKKYREEQLAKLDIKTVFPLWKRDTKELVEEFIALGFKSIVICVDANKLDASFAGRIIDEQFFKDLPKNVDPCGENGEFHTFCFDGPIFKNPVQFELGELTHKEYKTETDSFGFWFRDLVAIGK